MAQMDLLVITYITYITTYKKVKKITIHDGEEFGIEQKEKNKFHDKSLKKKKKIARNISIQWRIKLIR